MKRSLLLPLGTWIGGLLLCGYGTRDTLGYTVSSLCIVLGLSFSVGGFIAFILVLKKNKQGSNNR